MPVPFIDFEFWPAHDRLIPAWSANREAPWPGRVTRAALAALRGPIPDATPTALVFREVADWVRRLAGEKVKAAHGMAAMPVLIDVDDLWWARRPR